MYLCGFVGCWSFVFFVSLCLDIMSAFGLLGQIVLNVLL